MSQDRRRCAFCGDGRHSLTREHVWPEWIQGVLESDIQVPIYDEANLPSGRSEKRKWDDRPYRLKVRAVCRDCNGGWMSRLEQEAKPLLTQLMSGRSQLLDPPRQEVLAAWSFKTAAMHELRHGAEGRALPAGHRRILYETGAPPVDGGVWVGSYSGSQWGASCRQHSLPMAFAGVDGLEEPDRPNSYIVTLQIGRLVLQVWGHMVDDPRVTVVDRKLGGFMLHAFRRIWPNPSRTFAWPPPFALNDPLLWTASNALREDR